MPYTNTTKRNSVKLMMGKNSPRFGIMMDDDRATQSRLYRESASFDMIKSIRQILQKPDVSRIQLLSWLRSRKKASKTMTRQNGREWARFMAAYVRTNANDTQ